MLALLAEAYGDEATRATALEILADEQAMARRLAAGFDRALQASRRRADGDIADAVIAHLRDAHGLETQAMVLGGLGSRVAGSPALASAYRQQAVKTRRQRRLIARRLTQLGSRPAAVKDAGLALGGGAWSAIWAAQRDTAARLFCFVFAAVHLEVAAYELLRREAAQGADAPTEDLAERLLAEEGAAADQLAGLTEAAVEASLV